MNKDTKPPVYDIPEICNQRDHYKREWQKAIGERAVLRAKLKTIEAINKMDNFKITEAFEKHAQKHPITSIIGPVMVDSRHYQKLIDETLAGRFKI